MIDKIRKEVDQIFFDAPHTRKVQDLKEELVGNLEAKYKDLVEVGKTSEEAYNIVIASIGDIDELIASMEPSNVMERKREEVTSKKRFKIIGVCLGVFLIINLGVKMAYVTDKEIIDTGKEEVDVSHSNEVADIDKDGIKEYTSTTSTGGIDVIKEEVIQLGNIDFINMKLANAEVEISFTEGDEVRIIESTNHEHKDEYFETSQSGNTLNIIREEVHHVFSFGHTPYHKVEIFIPISFKEKLFTETSSGNITLLTNAYLQEIEMKTKSGAFYCEEEIEVSKSNISSTSGAVSINKISGENHNISTSSGEIEIIDGKGDFTIASSSGYKNLGHLVGDIHYITSSSGDIHINKLEGDGNIEATSGRIEINSIIKGEMDITSSSGGVIIKALEGSGRISGTSGEISIDMIQLDGDMMLSNASGGVNIRANDEANAEVEIETLSGDTKGNIEINYERNNSKGIAQFGNGKENKIRIATTSGDIELIQD